MNSHRTILLNPGPVTITPRVRGAIVREDLCHREPEFAELTLDIKARLARVYQGAAADFEPILLTGSGTCAVESMLSSLLPDSQKTLVVSNGVYGERIAAMLTAHRKPFVAVTSDWLAAMDLAVAEDHLRTDPAITHVVAVHHETTTGRLNDIGALADLCRQYNTDLLLDAVSSFGAEAIDFSHPRLLAVASTGNKCLHGIVGACFVLVRKDVFNESVTHSQSVYLDLFRYASDQRLGYSPFTQAVQSYYALHEALLELEEQGGWRMRHGRYQYLASSIRTALSNLGILTLLPGAHGSVVLSSFGLPAGWDYPRLHAALRAAGFVIYAGQGGLYHSMFRVANMGDIHDEDLQRLLETFRLVLAPDRP